MPTSQQPPRRPTPTQSGEAGAYAPAARCAWCDRELPPRQGRGRRAKYCSQACRQRAYERRQALQPGSASPAPSAGLSGPTAAAGAHRAQGTTRSDEVGRQAQRRIIVDLLFQLRCASEDVATAAAEGAGPRTLAALAREVEELTRRVERAITRAL